MNSDRHFAIAFGILLAALLGFIAGRVIPRHGDRYKEPFGQGYTTVYSMDDIKVWGFQLDQGEASPSLLSGAGAADKGWAKWTLTYYAKRTRGEPGPWEHKWTPSIRNSPGQERYNREREMEQVCAALLDAIRRPE